MRRHSQLALERGDFRSAEMLIETYLPAIQALAGAEWHVFNAHLLAVDIKLALGKPQEAEIHAAALRSQAAQDAGGDAAMETALAAIATAQVRLRQGRSADAAGHARHALSALQRAHAQGRITRQTFERERLAYEEVLIAASAGGTGSAAP